MIPVCNPTLMPTADDRDEIFDNSYSTRIIEDAPLRQVVTSVSPYVDMVATSEFTLVPKRRGCVLRQKEFAPMTIYEFVNFWLVDFLTDHLVDISDRAEGRPSRALVNLPVRQLLIDLSYMLPRDDAPGNQPEK